MELLRIVLWIGIIAIFVLIFFGPFLIGYFRKKTKLRLAWGGVDKEIHELQNFMYKNRTSLYSQDTVRKIEALEKHIDKIDKEEQELKNNAKKFIQEFAKNQTQNIQQKTANFYVDSLGLHDLQEEYVSELTCIEIEYKLACDKERYSEDLRELRYSQVLRDSIHGHIFEEKCKDILKKYLSLCDLALKSSAKKDFSVVLKRTEYFLDALRIPKMGVYRDKLKAYNEVIIK